MKKLVTILLVLVLAIGSLASCTSQPKSTQANTKATEANVQPAKTEIVKTEDKTSDEIPAKGIGMLISSTLKSKRTYKIAMIVKNSTNPYMISQLEGVKKAGEDMGFEAILMAPAKNDSVEEQVKIVEDMIQKGVDAIIVHCVDSNGIMPAVRKAEEAKIPFLTIGTPAAKDTFLRTGVNYEETGYVVAKQVCEKLGGKGDMIILEGPPGAQNAKERLAGIQKAVKEYPGVKIVASQTANFKRTEGMSVVENLLQSHKDVKAVIGANDESALGAVQALQAAGKKDVLVAGFDGSMDASTAIKEGTMMLSYNTDPYGSGYVAAAFAVRYLNDGVAPKTKFIPFPAEKDKPLITKDNVDEYVSKIKWWQPKK